MVVAQCLLRLGAKLVAEAEQAQGLEVRGHPGLPPGVNQLGTAGVVAEKHDAQSLPGPLLHAGIEIEAGMQVGAQHLGRAQHIDALQLGIVKGYGAPFAL
jgi:hypothetical protein